MRLSFIEKYNLDIDVNAQAFDGKTPLLLACEKKSVVTAAFLLDAGADPNLGTLDEMRPLIIGTLMGRFYFKPDTVLRSFTDNPLFICMSRI